MWEEKPSSAKSVHFDDANAGEWELPPIDLASQRAQAEVDLFRELGGIGVRAASAVPVADQLDRRIATAAREALGSRELGSRGVASSARGRGGTHDALLSRVRAMNEANAQARARGREARGGHARRQASGDRSAWRLGRRPPGQMRRLEVHTAGKSRHTGCGRCRAAARDDRGASAASARAARRAGSRCGTPGASAATRAAWARAVASAARPRSSLPARAERQVALS